MVRSIVIEVAEPALCVSRNLVQVDNKKLEGKRVNLTKIVAFTTTPGSKLGTSPISEEVQRLFPLMFKAPDSKRNSIAGKHLNGGVTLIDGGEIYFDPNQNERTDSQRFGNNVDEKGCNSFNPGTKLGSFSAKVNDILDDKDSLPSVALIATSLLTINMFRKLFIETSKEVRELKSDDQRAVYGALSLATAIQKIIWLYDAQQRPSIWKTIFEKCEKDSCELRFYPRDKFLDKNNTLENERIMETLDNHTIQWVLSFSDRDQTNQLDLSNKKMGLLNQIDKTQNLLGFLADYHEKECVVQSDSKKDGVRTIMLKETGDSSKTITIKVENRKVTVNEEPENDPNKYILFSNPKKISKFSINDEFKDQVLQSIGSYHEGKEGVFRFSNACLLRHHFELQESSLSNVPNNSASKPPKKSVTTVEKTKLIKISTDGNDKYGPTKHPLLPSLILSLLGVCDEAHGPQKTEHVFHSYPARSARMLLKFLSTKELDADLDMRSIYDIENNLETKKELDTDLSMSAIYDLENNLETKVELLTKVMSEFMARYPQFFGEVFQEYTQKMGLDSCQLEIDTEKVKELCESASFKDIIQQLENQIINLIADETKPPHNPPPPLAFGDLIYKYILFNFLGISGEINPEGSSVSVDDKEYKQMKNDIKNTNNERLKKITEKTLEAPFPKDCQNDNAEDGIKFSNLHKVIEKIKGSAVASTIILLNDQIDSLVEDKSKANELKWSLSKLILDISCLGFDRDKRDVDIKETIKKILDAIKNSRKKAGSEDQFTPNELRLRLLHTVLFGFTKPIENILYYPKLLLCENDKIASEKIHCSTKDVLNTYILRDFGDSKTHSGLIRENKNDPKTLKLEAIRLNQDETLLKLVKKFHTAHLKMEVLRQTEGISSEIIKSDLHIPGMVMRGFMCWFPGQEKTDLVIKSVYSEGRAMTPDYGELFGLVGNDGMHYDKNLSTYVNTTTGATTHTVQSCTFDLWEAIKYAIGIGLAWKKDRGENTGVISFFNLDRAIPVTHEMLDENNNEDEVCPLYLDYSSFTGYATLNPAEYPSGSKEGDEYVTDVDFSFIRDGQELTTGEHIDEKFGQLIDMYNAKIEAKREGKTVEPILFKSNQESKPKIEHHIKKEFVDPKVKKEIIAARRLRDKKGYDYTSQVEEDRKKLARWTYVADVSGTGKITLKNVLNVDQGA